MSTSFSRFTCFFFLLFMGILSENEASIDKVESNSINDISSSPESSSNLETDSFSSSVGQTLSLRTLHRHKRIAENTSPSSAHLDPSGQLWNLNESEEEKENDESKGNSRMKRMLKMKERLKNLKNAKMTRALIGNMKHNPVQMRKLLRSRRIKAQVMNMLKDTKTMHDMLNMDLNELGPFMKEMMLALTPIKKSNLQE
uniref:Uncharacterized protein n=1 Tax=Cacopsylla melanoneura TaxID=428564 RepID=A0A8D8YJD9_9HEMI